MKYLSQILIVLLSLSLVSTPSFSEEDETVSEEEMSKQAIAQEECD